jgi:hypothetical protein
MFGTYPVFKILLRSYKNDYFTICVSENKKVTG